MAIKRFKSPAEVLVGVIGYGGAFNMGKKHLEECQKAGMTPHAVCDTDPRRLDVAQAEWPGVETYLSVDEMLRKSAANLIVHITPHNLHAPLSLKCLKAGRNVVTEKPFTITTAECNKMIAEAKKRRLLLSVYHNRHWDGCILEARKHLLEKREIGDLVKIEAHMGGYHMPGHWWRTSKKMSGGILYDWGVHLLEYSLQILDDAKLVEVTGFAHNGHWQSLMPVDHPWKKGAFEDDASAIARFDNGVMLHLNISSIRTWHRPGWIEFMGTQGTYVMDGETWRLNKSTDKRDEKGRIVMEETTGKNMPGRQELYYQNVADALTGRDKLIITPELARRPIHILDLADRSAAAGRTLKAVYA